MKRFGHAGKEMLNLSFRKVLLAMLFASVLPAAAFAETFNIPGGDLATALTSYTKQTGIDLMVAGDDVKGVRTKGVKGQLSSNDALLHILAGTGFIMRHTSAGGIAIMRDDRAGIEQFQVHEAAATAPAASNAALETVTVTS